LLMTNRRPRVVLVLDWIVGKQRRFLGMIFRAR
jgi:hypothetical protein